LDPVAGSAAEADYPLWEMVIQPGDRFLLYTDGVSEPENGSGESFGRHKLKQVVRNNQLRAPSELLDQLLTEIREWQPLSAEQKDDITLVAIDVLS
jgi:sigma-B regulation protein RsbU (phosphoserine phosphatase)